MYYFICYIEIFISNTITRIQSAQSLSPFTSVKNISAAEKMAISRPHQDLNSVGIPLVSLNVIEVHYNPPVKNQRFLPASFTQGGLITALWKNLRKKIADLAIRPGPRCFVSSLYTKGGALGGDYSFVP